MTFPSTDTGTDMLAAATETVALHPDPVPAEPTLAESTAHSVGASPLDKDGSIRPPDRDLDEAYRRLRVLRQYVDLRGRCKGAAELAQAAGGSHASVWRWLGAIEGAGLSLDSPEDQLLTALAPGKTTGRPAEFDLTETEANALRGLCLKHSTQDQLHFSYAVEIFANHPACRPETATKIRLILDAAAARRRQPRWPESLRRAGYPTAQETAMLRGRKALQVVEHTDRRGMYYIGADGEQHPINAHTVWEMDDASDNEPRVHYDPDTGQEVITRQTLWTQDLYSAALLGFTQVARARDAYRIEDVADHALHSVETWGLPEFLRLEMGDIWDGSLFHGFVPDVPNWPAGKKWGGIEGLIHVVNTHKSKGKGGIEGTFNMVQVIGAHSSLSLGRKRGEFEEATKALIRSQRTGKIDPRFADIDTSGMTLAQVAAVFNARPKVRRAFGRDAIAPDDLLCGAKGPALVASERWRFCPIKRAAIVRGGHVEISIDHYPQSFRFRVNGVAELSPEPTGKSAVHLDHGYRVLVAFHPGRPDEGCHVFNAELGPYNRLGAGPGEYLVRAEYAPDRPQINLGKGDFMGRKKAAAAVRRSFRAIGAAVRADHVQDSRGRIMRAEDQGSRSEDQGSRMKDQGSSILRVRETISVRDELLRRRELLPEPDY